MLVGVVLAKEFHHVRIALAARIADAGYASVNERTTNWNWKFPAEFSVEQMSATGDLIVR